MLRYDGTAVREVGRILLFRKPPPPPPRQNVGKYYICFQRPRFSADRRNRRQRLLLYTINTVCSGSDNNIQVCYRPVFFYLRGLFGVVWTLDAAGGEGAHGPGPMGRGPQRIQESQAGEETLLVKRECKESIALLRVFHCALSRLGRFPLLCLRACVRVCVCVCVCFIYCFLLSLLLWYRIMSRFLRRY